MIARLLGHPRWRAKTRAGELLEAFGLAEAASTRLAPAPEPTPSAAGSTPGAI